MKNDNSLTQKRRVFCCAFARLGNIYEAALCAGFAPETALIEGMKTLEMPSWRSLIDKLSSANRTASALMVRIGLERLAFGVSNDAAALAFADEMPSRKEIDSLDLFNVSEIKRVKGGGVEVKLFDRQKALEKMLEISSSTDEKNAAQSFIEAITADNRTDKGGDDDEI